MKMVKYRFPGWIQLIVCMVLLFTIGLSADLFARDDFSQEIEQLLSNFFKYCFFLW